MTIPDTLSVVGPHHAQLESKEIIHKTLASPLSIDDDLVLKNRVIMSSLTRNRGVVPSLVNAEYYVQRASTGLIMSEGILIEPQGTEWIDAPGIYSKEQIEGWKQVTDYVHAAGGLMFAQLWHLGRVCHPYLQANLPAVGPSAIKANGGNFRLLGGVGYVTPVEIKNPQHYVEVFRRAAVNAKAAGFDGIELHAANGYLPNQFLDPISNTRTDAYSASTPQTATRFILEILDAFLTVFPATRIGIKLSPSNTYNNMSGTLANLPIYTHLVAEIAERGLGYVQIVRWNPSQSQGGDKIDVSAVFKPVLVEAGRGTKLFLNGDFTPEEGEQVLQNNEADAIVWGRNILSTPDFAFRAVRGVEVNEVDWTTVYTLGAQGKGYTDYPFWGEVKTGEREE
ncbi:hypothetical protein HDV00_007874 [Rhizophlyctis rosea]|nr:hypothetical protein HDV00_007874 [Rhizophlyctis rosea]